MYIINFLFNLSDFPKRLKNRFQILKFKKRSDEMSKSDSELTDYVDEVSKIINNSSLLVKFRRSQNYRMILEHLSFRDGLKYLQYMQSRGYRYEEHTHVLRKIDSYGKPRKFKYKGVGWVSPTSLRYLSIALDIREKFGRSIGSIAELGVGYGGLVVALSEVCTIQRYSIFDLEEVLTLTDKYLVKVGVKTTVKLELLEHLDGEEWDLFVSNYAFSELPLDLQIEYCTQVMSKSKNGFMIMNSGFTNFTGRSLGKMDLSELKKRLPNSKVEEENPKTGKDNYLFTWKELLQ
jgi:putative sugar O-methyltransferase